SGPGGRPQPSSRNRAQPGSLPAIGAGTGLQGADVGQTGPRSPGGPEPRQAGPARSLRGGGVVIDQVDWRAVLPAAAAVVAVGVMVNVIAIASGVSSDSSLLFVFYLVDLVAAGIAGEMAARRRLDTPLLHGALVGFIAYIAIAALSVAINVAAGHGVPRAQFLVFNAFMVTVAGVTGGYVASWRAQT